MRITNKGQVTIPQEMRERVYQARGSANVKITTADVMRLTRGDDWETRKY